MRGARTLCGYVIPHTDGESADALPHTAAGPSSSMRPRFASSVMFNGYPAPYREIQNRICHALINTAWIGISAK